MPSMVSKRAISTGGDVACLSIAKGGVKSQSVPQHVESGEVS